MIKQSTRALWRRKPFGLKKFFHTNTRHFNVITKENFEDVSEEDAKIIEQQLRRDKDKHQPTSKIIKRCKWGYPQVVFAFALSQKNVNSNEKFLPATLFWLTCPRIRELVSKLESEKTKNPFLIDLTTKIKMDPDIRRAVLDSDDNFKTWLQQSELLSEEEYEKWITGNRDDGIERRFGNAGSFSPFSIKCFHAHIVCTLLGINDFVGNEVYTYLINSENGKDLDCPSHCVRCEKFKDCK